MFCLFSCCISRGDINHKNNEFVTANASYDICLLYTSQYRMLRVERTAVNSSVPNEEEAKLESRYFADAFAGVHPEDMERVRSAYKARYAERQLKSSGVLKRGTMM